jgi:hypothetical protein
MRPKGSEIDQLLFRRRTSAGDPIDHLAVLSHEF